MSNEDFTPGVLGAFSDAALGAAATELDRFLPNLKYEAVLMVKLEGGPTVALTSEADDIRTLELLDLAKGAVRKTMAREARAKTEGESPEEHSCGHESMESNLADFFAKMLGINPEQVSVIDMGDLANLPEVDEPEPGPYNHETQGL